MRAWLLEWPNQVPIGFAGLQREGLEGKNGLRRKKSNDRARGRTSDLWMFFNLPKSNALSTELHGRTDSGPVREET